MQKPIMCDENFLSQKSTPATLADQQVILDLQDTLKANQACCVGMAANMIGVLKRIIIVQMGPFPVIMVNPVITKKAKPFNTEEGCLSLEGTRPTKRYRQITVKYLDQNFQPRKQEFSDWIAQIIQHEIDHCDGIII